LEKVSGARNRRMTMSRGDKSRCRKRRSNGEKIPPAGDKTESGAACSNLRTLFFSMRDNNKISD
jgi:hypothetical protein